jgi:hypothetical protein
LTQELALTPVRLGTDTADEEGRLVFAGDRLVAVLVRLAEEHEAAGQWFLEHGFGRLDLPALPTFADLQAAEDWIVGWLGVGANGAAGPSLGQTASPAPRTPLS